jgi:hypothetical protein
MPETPVEDAVKANCQAVLQGDMMKIMSDLTPEALNNLMAGGAGGGGMGGSMPTLTGFEIKNQEQTGDDHVFTVEFTGDQTFTAVATWRDVGGAWKIADLKMDQPS